MLPHVIRFNAADAATASAYEETLLATGMRSHANATSRASELLAQAVEQLVRQSGLATSLSACGVPPDAPKKLAAEAAGQWTARFNPRPVSAVDFERIYSVAMGE